MSSLRDEDSPLGLAKEVEQLLKLPQHLCKQRGVCCRVATFKGLSKREAIEALLNDPNEDPLLKEMARDFLSIFIEYETLDEVRELTPEFVEEVVRRAEQKGMTEAEVGLYHCRYVQADGRCGVHEDRPTGCRTYPFPHENTLYHKGCGYEQQGKENWAKIKQIMQALGMETP